MTVYYLSAALFSKRNEPLPHMCKPYSPVVVRFFHRWQFYIGKSDPHSRVARRNKIVGNLAARRAQQHFPPPLNFKLLLPSVNPSAMALLLFPFLRAFATIHHSSPPLLQHQERKHQRTVAGAAAAGCVRTVRCGCGGAAQWALVVGSSSSSFPSSLPLPVPSPVLESLPLPPRFVSFFFRRL